MIASLASLVVPPAMQRVSSTAINFLQQFLMVVGLIFIVGLLGVESGQFQPAAFFARFVPAVSAEPVIDTKDVLDSEAMDADPAEPTLDALSPRMRGALVYVSKRYRVSNEALLPIFSTAQATGKELHLDPLLIIAVIGIESGFNPFSQSVFGAQGLMQVVPRFHQDKLPEEDASFLDPITNVEVGAKVLKESIMRYGSLENGLQQFGGAINDASRRYAGKVLAERQRLEQATQRRRATT